MIRKPVNSGFFLCPILSNFPTSSLKQAQQYYKEAYKA